MRIKPLKDVCINNRLLIKGLYYNIDNQTGIKLVKSGIAMGKVIEIKGDLITSYYSFDLNKIKV